MLFLHSGWTLTPRLKYINSELKVKFNLDTTSKPKPVAGPDDLLLLLTQHWARDESVFPTEDDRHDVATIMLFQAYTGGRPAEFVHASKGKASQDPLGDAEEAESNRRDQKGSPARTTGKRVDFDFDDDSDADIGPEFDDDTSACSDQDEEQSAAEGDASSNKAAYASIDSDSGYNSDGTDVSMKEYDDEPARQKCDASEPDGFGEATREWKALCYEDLVLWVVRNPQEGERDVLAMEVSLRHHKGVDNKPKPYVASTNHRHQADSRV
jgi:hypothetical protein